MLPLHVQPTSILAERRPRARAHSTSFRLLREKLRSFLPYNALAWKLSLRYAVDVAGQFSPPLLVNSVFSNAASLSKSRLFLFSSFLSEKPSSSTRCRSEICQSILAPQKPLSNLALNNVVLALSV